MSMASGFLLGTSIGNMGRDYGIADGSPLWFRIIYGSELILLLGVCVFIIVKLVIDWKKGEFR